MSDVGDPVKDGASLPEQGKPRHRALAACDHAKAEAGGSGLGQDSVDHGLSLGLDPFQVLAAQKAFHVDLVHVFSA